MTISAISNRQDTRIHKSSWWKSCEIEEVTREGDADLWDHNLTFDAGGHSLEVVNDEESTFPTWENQG